MRTSLLSQTRLTLLDIRNASARRAEATSRISSGLVARAWRGVRIPASSSTFFMADLSRKGMVCSTVMPGKPRASRRRAASIMPAAVGPSGTRLPGVTSRSST